MTIGARLDLSLLHREAVQLLVSSAFPSASIAFFASSTCRVRSGDLEVEGGDMLLKLHERRNQHHHLPHLDGQKGNNKGISEHGMHYSFQKSSLQAKRGPFCDCFPPSIAAIWRRFYRNWPPKSICGRQPWRCDEEKEEPSLSSSMLLPCWTPHAVVYIGGYEAPDLRQIVQPKLFAQVPPLSSDTNENCTVGGKVFEKSTQRVPRFARKVLDEEFLLREKACVLHPPDLLEIAIPVTSSSSATKNHRILTLMSFADSQPSPNALQFTEDPMRRAALRPGFGYSIAALKYALPPPVVAATRLLRRWNALWSATPLSAAFWLSTVAHAVERLSVTEEVGALLIGDGTPRYEDCGLDEAAEALATAAAFLLKDYPDACMSNYFLPVEKLSGERGVMEIMSVAERLPVSKLCKMAGE